ncbi:MAG: ABC transporter ATP-binding protein [Rhizobiales bacterium 65-9]|nr:ABC transporter ATP-binding protein [Hyphomicrobiales bacterium]OJY36068.1 MAG: ABC transporter ATP-binding protein [Rhizobiales bacterium 65-9]
MTGAAPILRVDRLCAAYGLAQVLFEVSFTLARGETIALTGRNGAGKTTTLKTIMGLLRASGGSVSFLDEDVTRLKPFEIARRGLGYAPEDRRIFTDLTVDENLEVGRRAARGGGAGFTPDVLFEIFPNLAEMRHRRASAMSGGEQQMLAIARTLMGNPVALLLDEPSEGLAPVIVDQMAEALLRLKAQGLSMVLSEQNAEFAAAIADRAVLLEKGAVRFVGPLGDLASADWF